jgi:lipopolysaccharide biosynthesis glycosyltransferase
VALGPEGPRFVTPFRVILTTIQIAAASDENYAMPLAAMLASAQTHLEPGQRIHAYLLASGLSAATREKLSATCDPSRLELEWMDVGDDRLRFLRSTLRPSDHVSLASYARLLLPELVPGTVSRLIYLDCDVICRQSLAFLWEVDMGGCPVLAVPEAITGADTAGAARGIRLYRELGLASDMPLLNSGVIVFDLSEWRRRKLSRQAFDYVRTAGEHVRWHDQEAINVVLRGEWKPLPQRWNVSTFRLGEVRGRVASEAARDAAIVHYNSSIKPWQAGYDLPFGDAFFAALDRTPWRGFRPRRIAAGPLRRALGRVRKALVKRRGAARARLRSRAARRRGLRRLSRPHRSWPRDVCAGGTELRAFCLADGGEGDLNAALMRMLQDGIDRVVVGLPHAASDETVLPPPHPRVMLVGSDGEKGDVLIRQLLHCYGQGHWCLVVPPGGTVRAADRGLDSAAAVREFLEAKGFDAVACRDGNGPRRETFAVHAVARDPLTGKVCSGPALVDAAEGPATAPLRYLSRMSMFRYTAGLAIAAGQTIVGPARVPGFVADISSPANASQAAARERQCSRSG